jgi:hypothetical protein
MLEVKSLRLNKAQTSAVIEASRGITIKISAPSKATLTALVRSLDQREIPPKIASTKVVERKAVILAENGARIEIEAPDRDVLLAAIEVFRLDLLKDPSAMN